MLAWTVIKEYENSHPELAGAHGANVVFLGRMRDFNESELVSEMELEYYPGMTEKFLDGINWINLIFYYLFSPAVDNRQTLRLSKGNGRRKTICASRVGFETRNHPAMYISKWRS